MSTINQRSRQQRALVQRERELATWKAEDASTVEMGTRCRPKEFTSEGKAATAQRDIDNLKRKLSVIAATSEEN